MSEQKPEVFMTWRRDKSTKRFYLTLFSHERIELPQHFRSYLSEPTFVEYWKAHAAITLKANIWGLVIGDDWTAGLKHIIKHRKQR